MTSGPVHLFLDVDGPLLPFGAGPYPTFDDVHGVAAVASNPLLARLDPAHGPRLLALPCELVWATTWMAQANEWIAPLLGLPDLPVIEWPDDPEAGEQDARAGVHWKTRTVVDRAAGHPFIWADDDIGDADRRRVAGQHPGEALLLKVNASTGLTGKDYSAIDRWAAARQAGQATGTAKDHPGLF